MATLTAARKAEIAAELRIVASWVQGPRTEKVLELAREIEGEDDSSDKGAEKDPKKTS